MFGHYLHVALWRDHQLCGERGDRSGRHGAVRPTLMASVPRLYEKMYATCAGAQVRTGSLVRRRMFFWAKRVGEDVVELRLDGRPIPRALRRSISLADKLVFTKLRARTGGRIRFFISGGAPLSADIARFFHAAGMPDTGRLRTHGDISRHRGQHVPEPAAGNRWPADPRRGSADRARWRDSHARASRHERLLQQAGGHG